MRKKLMRRTKRDIQIIHQAVKTSTRQYISFSEMRLIIRQILQTLVDRYKQWNVKIVKLLHDQYYVLILVEIMWIELTSIHSNSRWCELYCEFSKVQLNSFFLSYCDYFVSSHQIHAKKDTCCIYSFTREKRYIE